MARHYVSQLVSMDLGIVLELLLLLYVPDNNRFRPQI